MGNSLLARMLGNRAKPVDSGATLAEMTGAASLVPAVISDDEDVNIVLKGYMQQAFKIAIAATPNPLLHAHVQGFLHALHIKKHLSDAQFWHWRKVFRTLLLDCKVS